MAIRYFVEYTALGLGDPRKEKTGPYTTYAEAVSHRDDIAGYESIVGAKIILESVADPAPEPKRAIDRLLERE